MRSTSQAVVSRSARIAWCRCPPPTRSNAIPYTPARCLTPSLPSQPFDQVGERGVLLVGAEVLHDVPAGSRSHGRASCRPQVENGLHGAQKRLAIAGRHARCLTPSLPSQPFDQVGERGVLLEGL